MGHLKHFPDKPIEHGPDNLDKWDKSEKFICQQKVDGWRMIIIVNDDGTVDFISRHDTYYTDKIEEDLYAEAEKLCEVFPPKTQIDSEWQSLRHCTKELGLKPRLHLFDVLRHGRRWVHNKPYEQRLAILTDAMSKLDLPHVALSVQAEPGAFAEFYEAQKKIPQSEGVVVKRKDHRSIGDRRECKVSMGMFKVKYRGASDGEMSMDHLRTKRKKITR